MAQPVQSDLQSYGELALQWFGVLGAMLAWSVESGISYAGTAHACSTGRYYLLYINSVVAIVVSIAAIAVAYRTYRLGTDAGSSSAEGSLAGRTHFMGLLGLLNSGFFTVVVLANALPRFILSPCD